jgi:hypothetical protein
MVEINSNAHVKDYYRDQVAALDKYDYSDEALRIINEYSNVIPEPTGRPERDWSSMELEEVWQVQATRLVEVGVHEELGLTHEEYLATLPKFEAKPVEFEGKFDIPILIDPRVSLRQLLKLTGVSSSEVALNNLHDWSGNHFPQPDEPYTAWADVREVDIQEPLPEELENADWSPEWHQNILKFIEEQRNASAIPVIRKRLKEDERGATALEGLYYYLYNPDIFNQDAIGRDIHILMVGSETLDPRVLDSEDRELRLFLGRYINAQIWMDNNGDPANTHTDPDSRALIVGK